MEETQRPAAEAESPPPADPSPKPAPAPVVPYERFSFSRVFEEQPLVGQKPAGVSNGTTDPKPAAVDPAPAPEAKSAPAPAERVSPPDAPTPDAASPKQPEASDPAPADQPTPSRREQERMERDAKIAHLEAENERLKANDPVTLRQQWQAEHEAEQIRKAAEAHDEDFLGREQTFRDLKARPYQSLSYEEQAWLDEKEERRANYQTVDRHYKSAYERDLAEIRARADASVADQVKAGWTTIKADIGQQFDSKATLPGVDRAVLTAADSIGAMAEHFHAAGAAWKEAELLPRAEKAEAEAERLRGELDSLKSERAQNGRVPASIGRTGGAVTRNAGFDPARGISANFRDAISTPSANGTSGR